MEKYENNQSLVTGLPEGFLFKHASYFSLDELNSLEPIVSNVGFLPFEDDE